MENVRKNYEQPRNINKLRGYLSHCLVLSYMTDIVVCTKLTVTGIGLRNYRLQPTCKDCNGDGRLVAGGTASWFRIAHSMLQRLWKQMHNKYIILLSATMTNPHKTRGNSTSWIQVNWSLYETSCAAYAASLCKAGWGEMQYVRHMIRPAWHVKAHWCTTCMETTMQANILWYSSTSPSPHVYAHIERVVTFLVVNLFVFQS